MVDIRRILVATDLSEISPMLYRVAIDMARPAKADLIVAHIADFQSYIEMLRERPVGVADYLEGLRSKVRDGLQSAGLADVSASVEVLLQQYAVPADIRALATRLDADLIIMGTHGRTGLRRALLGSVAEDVVRYAEVPVLVVPVAARRPVKQQAAVGAVPVKEAASNV